MSFRAPPGAGKTRSASPTPGPVPTELYVADLPASIHHVEFTCARATDRPQGDAVAVAVDIRNAARASDLLFGTGIGVVSMLDPAESLPNQARLSIAAGATEIMVPSVVLDTETVGLLRSLMGWRTSLTVDVSTETGGLDLDAAEQMLAAGADFVSFRPSDVDDPVTLEAGEALLALAAGLQLGGVKLGAPSASDMSIASVLAANDWAMATGKARLCLPIQVPGQDARFGD